MISLILYTTGLTSKEYTLLKNFIENNWLNVTLDYLKKPNFLCISNFNSVPTKLLSSLKLAGFKLSLYTYVINSCLYVLPENFNRVLARNLDRSSLRSLNTTIVEYISNPNYINSFSSYNIVINLISNLVVYKCQP